VTTLDDVRAAALAMPGVVEAVDGHRGGATWRVAQGLFVWQRGPSASDLTALAALGREWPAGDVIGLRTDGLDAKQELLSAMPEVYFTIPHFDGYPAVLARLDRMDADLLREAVTEAWLARVPARVAKEWLAANGLA
jgi:hypothetical protein